jgi:hypothetical protein
MKGTIDANLNAAEFIGPDPLVATHCSVALESCQGHYERACPGSGHWSTLRTLVYSLNWTTRQVADAVDTG